ncbi:MAG: ribosome small subunit-dependent GTPase A [Chloroflexi bacterium]|nr:ribosome small subunit-dependent GTPase A [Chloroflexota bacterium]
MASERTPDKNNQNLLQGLVIRSLAGYMTVRTAQGDVLCRVRGRLRRGRAEGDLVAVGDQALIEIHEDGSGSIAQVLPRKSVLSRQLSGVNYEYQQILLANPDQVLFVFACAQPDPSLRMLDRFLVVAEKQQIPAVIVANKLDLVTREHAQALFEVYRRIGYDLIYTSTLTGEGIPELKSRLQGKLNSLAGPSGVGKTSLLNSLQPGLAQEVGAVSRGLTGKGMHTTQVKQLFPLDGGGYLADVPGLRTLALWDIQGEELDAYFREIAPLVPECQFNDCTHSHEPGCAVRKAAEEGRIDPRRYDSYLRLRFGGKLVQAEDEEIDFETFD